MTNFKHFSSSVKARSVEVDVAKGVLTIGMVFAHVIQLLTLNPSKGLLRLSDVTNLVTFTGFLFCFGYAFWLAYLSRQVMPMANVFKTALKCYVAYVISGVAFCVMVSAIEFSPQLLFNVATVMNVPGYSEFLLSFALYTVLVLVFRVPILKMTQSPVALALSVLMCLYVAWRPVAQEAHPLIGEFFGGHQFAYFPIVPYGPIFLIGIYAARHKVAVGAWLAAAGLVFYLLITQGARLDLPANRFPPSPIWVVSSLAIFLVYFWLAGLMVSWGVDWLVRYLCAVGRNVLFYLLMTNLIIFTCKRMGIMLAPSQAVWFAAGLLLFLFYLQWIMVDPKERAG